MDPVGQSHSQAPPGRLREALGELTLGMEQRCPALLVSLWLVGSEEPSMFTAAETAAEHADGRWSSPIRSSSGEVLGGILARFVGPVAEAEPARQMVEAAAWSAGVLIELSRSGDELADYRKLMERVPAILYIADTGEHGRWR